MERERDISKQEAVVQYLLNEYQESQKKHNPLTRGELTLLRLAAMGLLHKEIAEKLSRESDSVEYAFHCMFKKLGVKNKHQAAVLAINSVWIDPIGYVGDSGLSLFETLTPPPNRCCQAPCRGENKPGDSR